MNNKEYDIITHKEPAPKRVAYLSFAPEDIEIAQELKAYMNAKGGDILPRPVYAHLAAENRTMNHYRIEDSTCVILIYTENTNSASGVLRDLKDAQAQGKPIFPLFLSDAEISEERASFVDTENYQILATCCSRKELFARLMDGIIWGCIFHY